MKRIFILMIAFAGIITSLQAQRAFELPLWTGAQQDKDAGDAELYAFLADNPNGKAIVICPGGGYAMLCMDYEGTCFAPWLNKYGISCFVLKYRMPAGRSTVPLADAEQAMRIVRSHAAEWKINPNSIGIMGSSAGGHLASTLATHYSSAATRPDFQVLLYPVITMDESFTHMGSRQNLIGQQPTDEQVKLYSNELQVTAQTPPAFIVVSSNDGSVPVKNSLTYTQALADHQVAVSLHVYPKGYHGFGFHDSFKDFSIWTGELLNWLNKEVK